MNEQINRAMQTSSYVRHSPPSLYATADVTYYNKRIVNNDAYNSRFLTAQRFTTKLLDYASNTIPRQTCGVYVLQSTHIDDTDFTNNS